MKHTQLLLALLLLPLSFANANETIRVGVLSFASPETVYNRWAPTFERVSEDTGETFTVLTLTPSELQEYVANDKLDFIIGNALTTVTFKKDYGVSNLLSLVPINHSNPDHAIGSALITRTDVNITEVKQLSKLSVISSDPNAFGGFQILAGELASHNINPFKDFKRLSFVGFPQDKLLNFVLDKQADVAILPSCVLESAIESGRIAENALKVVLQREVPDYECAVSSTLYPSYAFSKLGHTDHILATEVVKSLLSIESDDIEAVKGRYQYWSAPVNDRQVFRLLRILNRWPFVTNWEFLLKGAVPWVIGALIFLILGYLHHLRVKRLVVLRTKALSAEMEQHKHTQKKLFEQQKQFYKAQRVLLTGEMASGIAHELNQPLAGIRYLTQGCLYRLTPEQKELNTALNKAIEQVDRAQSTIKRFRQFCQQPSIYEMCDLKALVEETLNLMSPEFKRINLVPSLSLEPVITVADVSLIQQVLVNLIRNALDAMESETMPKLGISLHREDRQACIIIEDSGTGLSEEALSRLFFPFETSKEHGLGLGMVICKRIIEEHGGQINAVNLEKGLRISVTLPIKEQTDV
ncbi:PhnD/SsuA/transferrin family substrate-binding protein [uncultured Shewanella sp.]|uniref:sensor histidine kinase n=1 Tax=uncultured Shewanella sp. TaxID=173975 RepID=UPI002606CBF6|nr:PhnD/SsuA/transferrin family substrate-binding protein [uncultured Shewanella sp.]